MQRADIQLTGGAEARRGLPWNDWPAWSAFAVLIVALVLAAVGGAVIDVPAGALGVKITSKHVPPGIELADTIVQDLGFVLAAVLFAGMGARRVRSWQFGLRPTPVWRAVRLVAGLLLIFYVLTQAWAELVHVSEGDKKLLEQLGANRSTLLLVLSALLTTVIAPIAEETLFRGYVFGALSKWRGWLPAAVVTGLLFGAVHAWSAPVAYLAPLALLGFMLCWLYRKTGSLYPCFAAHALNNSIAFGGLEDWTWQIPLLAAGALASIAALALVLRQLGVISREGPADRDGGVLAVGP